MTAAVYLGLADWGAAAAGLYPEGLPEEWQEAYYATRFSCVWLSKAQCEALDPVTTDRLLADTPESFRFVLEPGATVPEVLAVRTAGADPIMLWFDSNTDLAELSARLQRVVEEAAEVFILSREGNLARIEQVRSLVQLLGL